MLGGALCFLGYILTGVQQMTIASPTESIVISARGRNLSEFRQFINSVDAAKNERYTLKKSA